MSVHAFVLHLARASSRRANAQALVEACQAIPGIDRAEIWPAVDGSTLDSTTLTETVGADLFAPAYPFALNPGEIGCFTSHRQIWAEIIRRDITAGLVIEDDVGLDRPAFDAAIALALPHITHLNYIKLRNTPPRGKTQLIDSMANTRLLLGAEPGLGMQSQLVSPTAAQHLLDQSEVFDRPVDTLIQSHWHTGLRVATACPAGVAHIGHQLEGSTIQKTRRKTLSEKLKREITRGIYRRRVSEYSRRSAAPMPKLDA